MKNWKKENFLYLSENSFNRYHVYEVFTRNHFPLSPLDRATDASTLQRVLWAPNNVKSTIPQTLAQGLLTGGRGGNTKISQAIAFVYENDIFYKPKVQTDLVCRITTTGNLSILVQTATISQYEPFSKYWTNNIEKSYSCHYGLISDSVDMSE